MPFSPVAAGQRIRASDFNAAIDAAIQTVYQTADQTRNNNTTYLSSPDLVLPLGIANAVYAFDASILYDTNSTADFKHKALLPSGAVADRVATWTNTTTGTAVDSVVAHDALTSWDYASGGVASGTIMCARPCGLITVGATTGMLVIQFAQNTANASNTILKRGSWVSLRRVG